MLQNKNCFLNDPLKFSIILINNEDLQHCTLLPTLRYRISGQREKKSVTQQFEWEVYSSMRSTGTSVHPLH